MNIQKSFIDKKPTLYLIPTPIGNYDDMTFRAIETLKMVDIIYCEDTRVTYGLLSHFKIETPLRAYHIFNEDVASTGIIEQLKQGKNVGLVSDAGMPVISDPGYLVSSMAIKEGYNVVSLPGANAALTALIASSIVANSFTFFGFLDHKTSQKEKQLEQVKDYKETVNKGSDFVNTFKSDPPPASSMPRYEAIGERYIAGLLPAPKEDDD